MVRGIFVALIAGVLTASLTPACSSAPDELDDPDLPAVTTNPDGEPYPTDHLGGRPRSPLRRGDRIPNFTFRGYRDGDRARGLEPIALADYFDPKQRRHKILHLQLAATWCAICSSELAATITVTEPLKERGVVFLEVLVSGEVAGRGPSLAEVDAWIDRHGTNFSTGIDVRARRLAAIGVSGSAMPHDILIDTRTMEILDSSVGAPADVGKYVLAGLRFVTDAPPSY